MFGYILVNPKTLSKMEKARYRAAYCGLCKQLRTYGAEGQTALSYDMTFIFLLINSIYELEEVHGVERCAMRPAPAHAYFVSEAAAYAADMNILFAYYKALDDWNDERDRRALARSGKLKKFLPAIEEKWPSQTKRASECIERLSFIEKQNVLNPDEPANCFGELMGEILDWKGDAAAGAGLRRVGEALGRYLYLLDASNDLREDVRNERYNPLIAQLNTDFEPLLTMLIGECTREFELLDPKRDIHLLRNVLYSGVWMKYRKKRKSGDNGGGSIGGTGGNVNEAGAGSDVGVGETGAGGAHTGSPGADRNPTDSNAGAAPGGEGGVS